MLSVILPLLAALLIFWLVMGGFSLAPWVPTKQRDIARVQQLLALRPGETLYELGCGDGRVCHALAKTNPQVQVVGIELSPLVFALAWLRNRMAPQPNLRLRWANIYHCDLSGADAIYVFGMPQSLQHLCQHLQSTKTKPVRIVSYSFAPEAGIKTVRNKLNPHQLSLYQYTIS